MKADPDFSRVTFKVNVSGSWANLVTCDTARIDEVKAACEVIAKASESIGRGSIRFKIVDAEGGELEAYGYHRHTGQHGWAEPARRSA